MNRQPERLIKRHINTTRALLLDMRDRNGSSETTVRRLLKKQEATK